MAKEQVVCHSRLNAVRSVGAGTFGSLAIIALQYFAALAAAQIPCSYTVQTLPAPPPCIWGPRPISPTGISPNGRYVSGTHVQCDQYDEACVIDTQSWQLITIPRPPGVYSAWCNDVNDAGVAVGGCWKSGAGMRGWIYALPNGPWVELTPVNPSSAGWCEVAAINAHNVVCGTRSIGSPNDPVNLRTAYTWSAQQGYTDLGAINGQTTYIGDINAIGTSTGSMIAKTSYEPFLWIDGSVTALGSLVGLETYAWALNDRNDVVGWSALPSQTWPYQTSRAFLWRDGAMQDLGVLPGHNRSVAYAIDSNGRVVGLSRFLSQTNQIDRGFIWWNGSLRSLTDLVGNGIEVHTASAIAENGIVVGFGRNSQSIWAALLLSPGPQVIGDANADCVVNVDDLLMVINHWGQSNSPADLNGDGIVNVNDLLIVIHNWT